VSHVPKEKKEKPRLSISASASPRSRRPSYSAPHYVEEEYYEEPATHYDSYGQGYDEGHYAAESHLTPGYAHHEEEYGHAHAGASVPHRRASAPAAPHSVSPHYDPHEGESEEGDEHGHTPAAKKHHPGIKKKHHHGHGKKTEEVHYGHTEAPAPAPARRYTFKQ
jgi:hypothetical protein